MSRSFGGTRLTTVPPIAISPAPISSSPAIIRSSVDLPQPDGPDQHAELAVGDRDVDAADHVRRAEVLLHRRECRPPPSAAFRSSRSVSRSRSRRGACRRRRRSRAGPVASQVTMFCAALRRSSRSDSTEKNAACGVRITRGCAEELRVRAAPAPPAARRAPSPASVPRVERGERGVDVDDGAARRVDEERAGLRRAQHLGVDHAARLGVERHVQRHDVACGEEPGERRARST